MLEIESIDELKEFLEKDLDLSSVVLQGFDVSAASEALYKANVKGTYFLGCPMPSKLRLHLEEAGASIFPVFDGLGYNPYRGFLYSAEELYEGLSDGNPESYFQTPDYKIFSSLDKQRFDRQPEVVSALAQRLHDHAITDALFEFLVDCRKTRKGVIAIMGGHNMKRSDSAFLDVSRLSRTLSRHGYVMVSGGGPGAMEATHVGAWFTERPESEMVEAVKELAQVAQYDGNHYNWVLQAFKVRSLYPPAPGSDRHFSLGVPTWLYGDEPATPFASHIGKYFANSIREDGLVSIATEGIVFAPGSVGTIQEVFQDVTQNHYMIGEMASPMVFFGVDYWSSVKPVNPLVAQLAQGKPWASLVGICDSVEEVVAFIDDHPPIAKSANFH